MTSMRIQVAKIVSSILPQRRDKLLHDESLPATVRGLIGVHLDTPWIPNFWTVAIRQVKPGCESYFDFPVGFAEDGTSWFFPARKWWMRHAHEGHAPDGSGCDVDGHVKTLTSEGGGREFDYAAVLHDGSLTVLGRADFVKEHMLWLRAFGSPPQDKP